MAVRLSRLANRYRPSFRPVGQKSGPEGVVDIQVAPGVGHGKPVDPGWRRAITGLAAVDAPVQGLLICRDVLVRLWPRLTGRKASVN